jgi:hypothetical protein
LVCATLLLAASVFLGACGGSGQGRSGSAPPPTVALPTAPSAPALGLTEDNAELLSNPDGSPGPAKLLAARRELTALHPTYLRLLVDWAALQPAPGRPPALEAPVSGCARNVGPCGAYAGIRAELAAIASQQRAAGAAHGGNFKVVIDIFGVPAWAARPPSGCERAGTAPFSRPLTPSGLAAYRSLIRSLLALAAREGVSLRWWSPWNEPNDPLFISPQRASCADGSPPVSPFVYAQLARAMAAELHADGGGPHELLLGELAGSLSDSPHRTGIASFVAALPGDVLCLGDVWSVHAYSSVSASDDPVRALESALAARGTCASGARIWVTETGTGAPHAGESRPAGLGEERAGCEALAAQLIRWHADPRVDAVFQYTFREDPSFPVGLISADLSRLYPSYRLWLAWSRLSAAGQAPPIPTGGCS